jgi:hypothetical protein
LASIKPLSIRYELGAGPEHEVAGSFVSCPVPGYAAVDRTLSLRTNDIVLTANLAAPWPLLFSLDREEQDNAGRKGSPVGQPIGGDEGSKSRGPRQVDASNLSSVLRPFLSFHSSINYALPAAEGVRRMCETRRDE